MDIILLWSRLCNVVGNWTYRVLGGHFIIFIITIIIIIVTIICLYFFFSKMFHFHHQRWWPSTMTGQTGALSATVHEKQQLRNEIIPCKPQALDVLAIISIDGHLKHGALHVTSENGIIYLNIIHIKKPNNSSPFIFKKTAFCVCNFKVT